MTSYYVLKNASLHYPDLLFGSLQNMNSQLHIGTSPEFFPSALSLGSCPSLLLTDPHEGDPSDVLDMFKTDALPFQLHGTPYFLRTDTLSSYPANHSK